MSKLYKQFLVIILILLVASLLVVLFGKPFQAKNEVTLTNLVESINKEEVAAVKVSGNSLTVTYRDDTTASSTKETEAALTETLMNYGVLPEKIAKVQIATAQEGGFAALIGPLSFILLPLLFFVFFFWMMFRQARTGISQAFDFTKTRARLFGAEGQHKERVTFKDVAGLREAKEEVQEVVDFLKNPRKYLEMGARIPRGVLLVGPPGAGKTLLARAVANEAGVPFFSASGSEFVELFVGVGSSRVRDLFATAKKAGRSIIFVDELDAIGRTRGFGFGGGHDEREQTLNQILVEMDGFERNDTRIVIAATNRPDVLDSALLRPGRFDRRIVLDLPDVEDRESILAIHAKDKPLEAATSLKEIAERTPGFSGADLANLMNEAAILAARFGKTQVTQAELLEAIDKVLLGPERKSHILSPEEKRVTAYHEAGHALTASLLPHTDPVRKISIISRGRAGGYTLKLPKRDKYLKTKTEFLEEIAVLLGGYVTEKLVFKQLTTGASNDLEKASEIARSIVKDYGMSDALGPVTYGNREQNGFLPTEEVRNYSEETASQIDKEVRTIIEEARKVAERVLKQRRKTLDKIAQLLIEKETIEQEEFQGLLKRA